MAAFPVGIEAADRLEIPAIAAVSLQKGGLQPQTVVDDNGMMHVVYFSGDSRAGDLYYIRSSDGGRTFSPPLRVNSQAGSAIAAGSIRGAQLAIGRDGWVHVAWNGSAAALPKASLNPEMSAANPNDGVPMLYARLNNHCAGFEPQRNVMTRSFGLDGGGSIAADAQGHVYIAWHGRAPGSREGEAGRQVFLTRSDNDGADFTAETPISHQSTGACACCGMRIFADRQGNVYGLYRSATDVMHRDIYFLASRDHGRSFASKRIHEWEIGACPMSSMSFAQGPKGVAAAWETAGQVFWAYIDSKSQAVSQPVGAPGEAKRRKHPSLAIDLEGRLLMAWVEAEGWQKAGRPAWQVFDPEGRPLGMLGSGSELPVWSFVAATLQPNGAFALFR